MVVVEPVQVLRVIGNTVETVGGMTWQILWILILGVYLSIIVESLIRKETVSRLLGFRRPKNLVIAGGLLAVWSSRSHAAVVWARTLFRKCADFVNRVMSDRSLVPQGGRGDRHWALDDRTRAVIETDLDKWLAQSAPSAIKPRCLTHVLEIVEHLARADHLRLSGPEAGTRAPHPDGPTDGDYLPRLVAFRQSGIDGGNALGSKVGI
jgi:hypothetical protein